MSYCRWSSDNFKCDLYCYESATGFVTHVAGNRIVGDIPVVPGFREIDLEGWHMAHEKQSAFLENATREPIGLPHDGETFNDVDLEDFKERLLYLRKIGYSFPDYVLETVEEELKEQTDET